jgi:hypothetical protein
MDFWREELAAIKARQAVQDLALQALVRSHPDPRAVLDAWQKLRAQAVTDAYAVPGHRGSEWLGEHVQTYAEAWTRALAQACGLQVPEQG